LELNMADAAKPAKWALESAVIDTSIPPPAKLIMLVLLARTGPGSLDLGRFSPGTRRLADQTGMKRETLLKYLGLLEDHGWLAVRKSRGRRAEYILSEGRPFDVAKPRKPPVRGPKNGTTPPVGGTNDGTITGPKNGTTTGPTDGTTTGPTDGTTDKSFTGDKPSGMTASQTVSPPGEEEAGHVTEERHPEDCKCFDCIFPDEPDAGSADGQAGIK
jgi:hypothetical protein